LAIGSCQDTMASQPQLWLRDRHAFRPDLRDAQLEDRPLMATIVAAFPPLLDGNALYGIYLINWGGPSGPLSGGGGPISPTGASTGTGPGSSLYTGGGTSGGLAGALWGVLQNPAKAAQPAPARPSNGNLLGLPASYDPSTSAAVVHNNGPIGGAQSPSLAPGQSDAFSSGGNFAASYSGTYNGFTNATDLFAAASGNVPQAPQRPDDTPPPTMGQPISPRFNPINPAPSVPGIGNPLTVPFGTFSAPTPVEAQPPGTIR
jgi:hypothetical protein